MSALLSLYRFLTQHISITTTISITMTLFSSTGQINSPGWILKSSRGTELAVWPMCCRISSSSPVGTQLMLFGSPSAVKKSTERDRQLHSSGSRKYSRKKDVNLKKKIKLELLDYKGAIYLARGSQANVYYVKSFHPWIWCMPPHISCHIWQLLPATPFGKN